MMIARNISMGLLLMAASGTLAQGGRKLTSEPAWQANGTLLEACSCSVPCPCNFSQSPSRGFCNTVYAYRLKTARMGAVKLDGLAFGGGEGPKGVMGFLDARAAPEQRQALEKLARAVFAKGGASIGPRSFAYVPFTFKDDARSFQALFGANGGFSADILIGRDGKSPIIVENNATWPVARFIKGKTNAFDYKDIKGNALQYEGVNANKGEFSLSE